MSERFKYAINGVYKCENFQQHLAGRFPDHYIGSLPWRFRFFITLKIREGNNQVYLYVACAEKRTFKIRAFVSIRSKSWSLSYKTEGSIYLISGAGVSGPSINSQDVLNEENGYLENGALTVDYGFHIDAILDKHDIWTFNLYDRQFNSNNENNTVAVNTRCLYLVYYSPKPLLAFHSPLFKPESKQEYDDLCTYMCLQIANGVCLHPAGSLHGEWLNIAEVGRNMKLINVVHYCDQKIHQTCPDPLKNGNHLKKAIKLNARRCVSRMIGLWNFKELLEELTEDLDEIPGEMMKVIIRRFIRNEF